MIPLRHIRSFPNNKPWFRSHHHRLRRQCHRLFNAAKRSKTTESWTTYRMARNLYPSKLRKSKIEFYGRMTADLLDMRGTYQKEQLLLEANIESLTWRRHILCLTYFHHLVHEFPGLLERFNFKFTMSGRKTNSLVLPPAGTRLCRSFIFQFAIAWNKLPADLRSIRNGTQFKHAVKREFALFKYKIAGLAYLFQ